MILPLTAARLLDCVRSLCAYEVGESKVDGWREFPGFSGTSIAHAQQRAGSTFAIERFLMR